MPSNFIERVQRNEELKAMPLVLDEDNARPARTRGELYKELTKNEKQMEDEDYFVFSSPSERGISLVLDLLFIFAIVKISFIVVPVETKLLDMIFFEKYKLVFSYGDHVFSQLLKVFNIFAFLLIGVVFPMAFFNNSFGKKLLNLRVRGDDMYSISIAKAFSRELIYKPLSIVCLVGFILPFFDKKKKSIHDKLAGTFVIKK
jgi:uncharacterized RDD family membrane protein YckC